MKNLNKKTVGTIRAKIGSVEIITLLAFLLFLYLALRQAIKENFQQDWVYLIFFILALISFLMAFINFKNKTIIFTSDRMTVKRPLGVYSKTYLKDELRGYDLQEYYDNQIGLAKQIRIWTKKDKQIVLLRDAYSDYDKILKELKKFDLRYLGTVSIKNKYKTLIGVGLQIISTLAMLMFAALTLIKSLK